MSPVEVTAKKVGSVMETTDYSRFRFIKGNRNVNDDHVNQMLDTMLAGGHINHMVTAVEHGAFYDILDGQHYFTASKKGKFPFRYHVIDLDSNVNVLATIQKMNCWQKPWESADYEHSFIVEGKPAYIKLHDFRTDFNRDLGVDVAIILLGTDQSSRSMKIFRLGGYKMGNVRLADKRLVLIKSFEKDGDLSFAWSRNFIRAVGHLSTIKNYDHDRMLMRLKRAGLKKQASVELYMEAIREIYNTSSLPDMQRI